MSIQQVLLFPDKGLRVVSEPVTDFEDEEFKTLVEDLKQTAMAYRAHGLAAPQIGVNKRVFVTHTGEAGEVKVFVNPEILETHGKQKRNEGCLSFPGVTELLERAEEVVVKAFDEKGEEFTLSCDDLDATAILHETDHLDGVLFIERMSRLKKRFVMKKLNKMKRRMQGRR